MNINGAVIFSNWFMFDRSKWWPGESYARMGNVTLRREQSTDMGGVLSSSLSVERLQGAEVVSAHLSISGGSRPAELFSDGYLRKHRDPRNTASSQPSSRFIALHPLTMPDNYICFNTGNIESFETRVFNG